MKKLFLLAGILIFASQTKAQTPDFVGKTKQFANWEKRANAWKVQHHSAERNAVSENYNVTYHRCEWNVDPNVYYISGSVTTYFIPTTSSLQSLELDLSTSMTVDSVHYHGTSTAFTHGEDVLSISFPGTINQGVLDSVTVYYQGAPVGSGFGSFTQYTHGTTPIIWTLSEPYGAKDWWPCKQSLTDKIDSIDILVTCPAEYRDGSNGVLVSETQNGSNKTYHWKSHYPIATYLVAIAVTNYSQYSDYAILSNGNSLQILNYVYPEDLTTAQALTPAIVPVIELYDSLIIDYPFANEKYGHCEFGWGGGMEHQTMTYVSLFDEYIIAHECAHQWFGDKVTLGSWADIWLNEGFATFFEGLTQQNLYPANWAAWKQQHHDFIVSDPSGSVFCTDTTDIGRIFDSRLSYSKGAYLLHMLRGKLGDVAFFNGLKEYLNDPKLAYKYARTADLKQHLENASGKNLTSFFNQWYYGQGYPTYKLRWYNTGTTWNTTISQTQSDPSVTFFEMPVPAQLKDATHDTTVILNNTFSGQSFNVKLSFAPTQVILDPQMWVLHANDLITKVDTLVIITSPLSSTSFCPKASLNVSYEAAGTFNSGNVFKAQISNASGSFANPTTIGTLTSTANKGTISASLPVTLSAGTAYRIRIVSTIPVVNGIPNTTNLTIKGCDMPLGLTAGSLSKKSVVISWNGVNCAYSYILQYRKTGTSTWTSQTIIGATSYTINGLSPKTQYDYQIKTVCTADGTSSSAFTAVKTFTTTNSRNELTNNDENNLNDLVVYPNPAVNDFTLEVTSAEDVGAIIIVSSILGEQFSFQHVTLNAGVNQFHFNAANFSPGTYFVTVQSEKERMVKKFAISK